MLTAIALSGRVSQQQLDVFIDHVLLERPLNELAGEYGVSRARLGQEAKTARAAAAYLLSHMELAA